jgi:predicted AlkP superfamily phosphohydrolase/phosphomutase
MSVRTLFIGMDGATFTVIDDLTKGDAPVMPFLAGYLKKGTRAILGSTPNPLTPPAWVSLMTGKQPGSHGLYDFLKSHEVNGELYTELSSALDCKTEMVWSIASRQDRRVAALNLPFTAPPPRDLNGIILPGFVPWKHLRRNTQPRDFYGTLKQELPTFDPKQLAWDFEHEEKSVQSQQDDERKDWVTYHLHRDEQWFEVAKYVTINEGCDLVAVMFDGTDKLQHQVWPYVDPANDHENADEYHKEMRELSLQYYRNVDRYIETLVGLVGPDAQVFLASDHGFTGQQGVFYVNQFLEEHGYLSFKTAEDAAHLDGKTNFLTAVDITQSLAYCRTPSSNGIFIRQKPSDNDIGVDPADYDAFCDKLKADLMSLVDPVSGEQVVTAVRSREEIFAGPTMMDAPDLTLTLRDSGFVSNKRSDAAYAPLDLEIGTHHPDGVFIASGPGISEGASLERRDIPDVAAILLHSLGLEVPSDFEGKVPNGLFTADHTAAHPVKIGAETLPPAHMAQAEMSPEEKEVLMGQLAALGYAD